MKFYREKFFGRTLRKFYTKHVINNKIKAIISCKVIGEQAIEVEVTFFDKGEFHNNKNAAIYWSDKYKDFYLKSKSYGSAKTYTKQSWRRFVKMQTFL
jgi:hypothetical protein